MKPHNAEIVTNREAAQRRTKVARAGGAVAQLSLRAQARLFPMYSRNGERPMERHDG